MRATGIVRKVDVLGRIVLPVELRKNLDIEREDPIEIYVDGEYILLKKYEPACIFCSNAKNVKRIHDKNICGNCVKELQAM